MRRTPRTLLCSILLIALHLACPVRGALWLPHPLNALVALSDSIVLADRVGTRTVTDTRGNAVTLTRYRLKTVYRGALLPGAELEVLDTFPRTPSWFKTPVSFDPGAILFLSKLDKDRNWSTRNLSAEDLPEYSITHSGLRLLKDDEVYTFAQFGNPGPIQPTPLIPRRQWLGDSVVDLGKRPEATTIEEFERDLRESISRVETFRRARKEKDVLARRETIIGLLKPYEKEAEYTRKHEINWLRQNDAFLQEIVEFFLESGDLEGALEVLARTEREDLEISPDVALEAATTESIASHRRAAAIGNLKWRLFDEKKYLEPLAKLAHDPDRLVSEAARDKLLWLRRGYEMNDHKHTGELSKLWEKILAGLEKAPPPKSARQVRTGDSDHE